MIATLSFWEINEHKIKLSYICRFMNQEIEIKHLEAPDLPQTMEARISQNTRLAKKKSSCKISIVRWAWLLGKTSSPHLNSSRPLLHAVQPPRNHGQKPSWTMYRITQWDRVWAILGGQDKNDGILTFLFVTT